MLHTPKKRIGKKTLAIVIAILFVIVAVWLYLAHHCQIWPFQSAINAQTSPISRKIDYSQPSNDQTKNGADIKTQVADSSKDGETTAQSPSTAQQSTLGVTITTVQPGQTVYIRAVIDSVISPATCTLTMTGPNGKTYSATASVQPMASSSTCQGFNIPMTSLMSGSWKITIVATDGANTGSATTEKTL
jgi:cytoskeletal protein RodZ